MKKGRRKGAPFLLGIVVAGAALAAGPVSGSSAALASNCYNCNGTDGRTEEAIPPLAGLPKAYIAGAQTGAGEACLRAQNM